MAPPLVGTGFLIIHRTTKAGRRRYYLLILSADEATQIRTLRPAEALTRRSPLRLKATQQISLSPWSVSNSLPPDTSQSRTRASSPALTTRVPSRLKVTHFTSR